MMRLDILKLLKMGLAAGKCSTKEPPPREPIGSGSIQKFADRIIADELGRPCVCCGDYTSVIPGKIPVCKDCKEIAGWN
jgi:hypothetical protein